ncbi:MAG TPA: alkaline phosphatase family protein [Terriglobales bacterium]|nr:alkaline phosphatase family protein [Terriglobales bacterium]
MADFSPRRPAVPGRTDPRLDTILRGDSREREITGVKKLNRVAGISIKAGTTNSPRQLLLGLDAMEWTLIEQWAAEGKLPAFRRLLEEGARAELASTAAQLPDTVWSAIYSGTNPAKFAKYFYVQYDPESGDLRMLDDDAIGAEPFWDHLSTAGKRVCVFDVPKFPVSRQINGIHLANWGAHASRAERASQPPGLLGEMDKALGRHPVGDCDTVDENPKSLWKLRRRLLAGVQLRGEVCRSLMERENWDVFFAAFSETHCAGHHFWHFLDATHPRHDPADTHGLRDTIESVYRAVDRQVGQLVNLAGPETRCLIFSGHGMGPIWHASWSLQEILNRMGFGKVRSDGGGHAREAAGTGVNPWRILKMKVPGRFQYAVKAMLPKRLQEELIFRWYAGGRQWAGCRAIAVPNNDSVGAIRILIEGRDRHGIVPAAEYRKICEAIAAGLQNLVDPATGRKVVRQVTLTHEEFRGPFLDRLPDLTVLWDQTFAWEEVASASIRRLKIRRQDSRSGSHTPRGFLVARGYGEPAAACLPLAMPYDIAATVLSDAGIKAPAVMDGRSLFSDKSS